jgi:hypothetical protein
LLALLWLKTETRENQSIDRRSPFVLPPAIEVAHGSPRSPFSAKWTRQGDSSDDEGQQGRPSGSVIEHGVTFSFFTLD